MLVDRESEKWLRVAEAKPGEEQAEIEALIVPEIVAIHKSLINGSGSTKKIQPNDAQPDGGELGISL